MSHEYETITDNKLLIPKERLNEWMLEAFKQDCIITNYDVLQKNHLALSLIDTIEDVWRELHETNRMTHPMGGTDYIQHIYTNTLPQDSTKLYSSSVPKFNCWDEELDRRLCYTKHDMFEMYTACGGKLIHNTNRILVCVSRMHKVVLAAYGENL